MLKTTLFILENKNTWREILSQKPYCLTIKEDGRYILFSYSQVDSDFSNPIVQECRGLILTAETFSPVCVPFFKFFNVQEGHAATIDWRSARVFEKIDGSIIKVWYHRGWHVSTNGTIDAFKAELQSELAPVRSFGELFLLGLNYATGESFEDFTNRLDKGYTYLFELISPYNRIVVPHNVTNIIHIGARNNITLKEEFLELGISRPNEYNLSSLEECLSVAKVLPFDDEGYVVVDANWNRVKIKSANYVAAHHLKNNGVVTYSRIVDMIMSGEWSEFLGYYPEYEREFESASNALNDFIEECEIQYNSIPQELSRRDFAQYALKTVCPPVMFALLDGKFESVYEWTKNQNCDKMVEILKLKNKDVNL